MRKRDPRQRELKRAYKRSEKDEMRALMLLDEDALENLLDFVDERVLDKGCDETLRFTAEWAINQDVPFEPLKESLGHFGGYCDCEVAANVEPEEIF